MEDEIPTRRSSDGMHAWHSSQWRSSGPVGGRMMVVQKTAENSPAAIAALTCNETDALLKVKYNITE
eukprot:scaffold23008_cov66-Skeletonema_marinoi.AAC.2